MSYIRIIKPALFRCEKLFEAEQQINLPLRLAFIGLFTCCDDEGRFRWQAPSLKLDVLPYDNINFAAVLDALATYGFIVKFMRHDQYYGFIPNWHHYQSVVPHTLSLPTCHDQDPKQHTANTALIVANASHNDQTYGNNRQSLPTTLHAVTEQTIASTRDNHADS